MSLRLPVVVAVLLAVGAAAAWGWPWLNRPPVPQPVPGGAALRWTACWFPVSFTRPVHCGRFSTATADGPPFELPVVYVPARPWRRAATPLLYVAGGGPGRRPPAARTAARPWRRAATPLLYVAGGPGGATLLAADQMPAWLAWLDAVDWPHDTVLYDQRGVGLGQPLLDCPELLAERRALLPLALDAAAAGRRLQAAARACRDRLEAAGHDLGRFTTRANATDARDLMTALGAARWDLYGVSYGSRVALDLMRLDPGRLRAVILDSVYPPEVQPEPADPWLLARALGLVSRVCDLLEECRRAPADVAADLATVLQRLRDTPLRTRVPDPTGSGEVEIAYGAEDFAWLLFEALYRWDRLARLPRILAGLAEGTVTPGLQALATDQVATALDASFSDAVAGAVDCNDSAEVAPSQAAAARASYPAVADLTRHDWASHPCRVWKASDAGAAFRRPVVASVPTLLMTGEFDPVTPPQWAAAAADRLPNGHLFEFPGIGHGVLDSHQCAVDLVKAFLAAPLTARAPACLGAL